MEKRSSFRITAAPPCGETSSERRSRRGSATDGEARLVHPATPFQVGQVGADLRQPVSSVDQPVQGVVDDDCRHLADVAAPLEPSETVVVDDLYRLTVESFRHAVVVQGQSVAVRLGLAHQLVVGSANHGRLQRVIRLRRDGVNLAIVGRGVDALVG